MSEPYLMTVVSSGDLGFGVLGLVLVMTIVALFLGKLVVDVDPNVVMILATIAFLVWMLLSGS